jgi:hypothetical protein
MGVATSMDALGDGTFQLVLDVERGSVPPGRARVRGLQEDQAVAEDGLPVVGTTLRVVRLRPRQPDSGDDVWANSGTEFWAMPRGESQ